MATQLYLRFQGSSTHRGTNSAKLNGSNSAWMANLLSTSTGSTFQSRATDTVAGPTSGVECTADTTNDVPMEWISLPLDADTTISGTITVNLWAFESNMAANVAINAIIERLDSQGAVVSTIAQTARTTELGFSGSPTVQNFTVTPTSTNMLKGDRIRVRIYGDDSTSNMASGHTFTLSYDGSTGGAAGDSYVSFTETFGFLTTTPAGSTLYLTDVAGPAVGSAVEKEMWTSRGDGVNSIVRNTAAGWTAPLQWTDSAGGTVVEWYSKQLTAFTLSGLVRCNLRCLESSADAQAGLRAELAVCDNDGTNVAVWGATGYVSSTTSLQELDTTEAAHVLDIAGDDLSVTSGQRLRLRVFLDDQDQIQLVTGHSATLYYDGTSGGASGDSYITLSQTVTELSQAGALPLPQSFPPMPLMAM